MFKRKNKITISVSKDRIVEVQNIVDHNLKLVGSSEVYVDGDTAWFTFMTTSRLDTVNEVINKKVYNRK